MTSSVPKRRLAARLARNLVASVAISAIFGFKAAEPHARRAAASPSFAGAPYSDLYLIEQP
jgi:hypothetical protein